MIFNLNEQKVLSDPSGSSVFKGEKDFNDIVVNLPDNIDGHTATELNYVMHFVDSDGGYSTKILTVDSSGEALKATATVSTSITSKAQAFYAYVLMTDDEETVIGKTNGVIVMIHPVPDEENEIIPPADADKIIKGLEEIVKEATETIETATDTIEEATEAISSKQDKLTAGQNITIDEDNVISAEGGGVTSYNDLTDLPDVSNYAPSQQKQIHQLIGTLDLYPFTSSYNGSTKKNSLRLDVSDLFEALRAPYTIYNFEDLPTFHGAFVCEYANSGYFKPLPDFMKPQGNFFVVYNLCSSTGQQGLAQILFWKDKNSGEAKSAFRVSTDNFYSVSSWQEIGGGSQIVSGVVNTNGTITFTDSDGNTFTTTGSSVIGPQGDDYVLTAQDKSDIADIVLSELPTTQGVLYGNTNN